MEFTCVGPTIILKVGIYTDLTSRLEVGVGTPMYGGLFPPTQAQILLYILKWGSSCLLDETFYLDNKAERFLMHMEFNKEDN